MRTVLAAVILSLASLTVAKPNVLVTTGQLADVARNVAGEYALVTAMMGPGVDPHLYRATPRDVVNLQQADLILYHGMGLEGQLADVLERFADIKPTAAIADEALADEELLAADEAGTVKDPHVWMDASLFSQTAMVIAGHLANLDPGNADVYRANAVAYRQQLLSLHQWIGEAISSIPERNRQLVTAHDAFAYYGRAYVIEVAAVQGLSTESEAGIADIRATAELIIEAGVPAVFVESTINPRTIQAVLETVNASGTRARLGGELYSDAMGPEGEPEGTYIGMLIHNTSVITGELGGQLPELPAGLPEHPEAQDGP